MNATDDWYDVEKPADRTWSITEGGMFGSQLLAGDERALLIDAGAGIGDIRGMAEQLVDVPVTLLLTHAHWDHVGNGHRFERVLAHPLAHDAGHVSVEPLSLTPEAWAEDWLAAGNELPDGVDPDAIEIPPVTGVVSVFPGTTIELGGRTVELLATPGHAADHLSVLDRGSDRIFVSDVVHIDYDCYAHFPGGDVRDYCGTLDLLVDLFDAGAYDEIHFSHVPPLSGGAFALVRQYRDAFSAIHAGEREGERVEDPDHPYRRYAVAGNEIRMPG